MWRHLARRGVGVGLWYLQCVSYYAVRSTETRSVRRECCCPKSITDSPSCCSTVSVSFKHTTIGHQRHHHRHHHRHQKAPNAVTTFKRQCKSKQKKKFNEFYAQLSNLLLIKNRISAVKIAATAQVVTVQLFCYLPMTKWPYDCIPIQPCHKQWTLNSIYLAI